MLKIKINNSRTLKLNNVLMYKCILNEEKFDLDIVIEQMQTYIKVKAAEQIGPLVQLLNSWLNETNEVNFKMILLLQCNRYIHNVEEPYSMDSIIRVPDCLYCRYTGPEDKIKFAYDKLGVYAFEEDIELSGQSYTVFLDKTEDDEIIADIFMEKAK